MNVKGALFCRLPFAGRCILSVGGFERHYFRYGLDYRRAFNPSKSYLVSGFPWGCWGISDHVDGDVGANIPAYKEQFEVCLRDIVVRRMAIPDKISYNGYYDYLPDENFTGTATNYKDQIEYSELKGFFI